MQFGTLRASDNPYKRLKLMAYTGMALSVVALVLVAALSVELSHGLGPEEQLPGDPRRRYSSPAR